MLLSEDFKFNNVLASSLGLKLVRMDSSMFIQEPTIGGANLVEAEHPYDFKQYLYKVKRDPIEFDLQLALVDSHGQAIEWTLAKKRQVMAWLIHNGYREINFMDEKGVLEDAVYYGIVTSAPIFNTVHNKGYLEFSMRTNSPYAWTKEQTVTITGSPSKSVSKTITIAQPLAVDKVFFKATFTKVGGWVYSSTNKIYNNVSSMTSLDRQGQTYLLEEKAKDLSAIVFNGKTKTIMAGQSSIYHLRSGGARFPYLQQGANPVITPQGWSTEIVFQAPILI